VCVFFFVGGEKNIENVDPQWVIFIFKMELVLFPEQVWVWGKSLYTVVLSWTYIVFVWGKYLHLVIESYSLLSECSITRKPWSLRVKKQRVKVWGSNRWTVDSLGPSSSKIPSVSCALLHTSKTSAHEQFWELPPSHSL